MQITLERQSKTIALSFHADNSIAYDELYLAVQDKMSAIVNGGKFFVGKAFTIVGNAVSVLSKNIYVQGLTVAVAGGLGSRLAGGSFELGFLTAGLAFAVNQVVTQLAQQRNPNPSAAAIDFIAEFEGFESTVAPDPVGIPTVGFGHKVLSGESFSDPLTREQGLALLRADVNRVVLPGLNSVSVDLTQNQVDALSSFIFNVGPGAFGRSTLLQELNAGNFNAVPNQIRRFTFSGGRRLPGLVRRREAEAQLFTR